MFGYKLFAFGALALAVVATESCAPTTVTATVTDCNCKTQSGELAPTAPVSVGIPGATTVVQSLPEQQSSGAPAPAPSGPGAAPPASASTAVVVAPGPESGAPQSSEAPATTTVEFHSSSGAPGEPSSSGEPAGTGPNTVPTAAAALATPLGMGSFVAMGAAALAVVV